MSNCDCGSADCAYCHSEPQAPSCDSPELADIRAELKRDHYLSDANAETLLRMVDELTAAHQRGVRLNWSLKEERDELAACSDFQGAVVGKLIEERDELRAKLAESERAWRTWNTNMSIEASKWEQRAGELEAKLAEAEKAHCVTADILTRTTRELRVANSLAEERRERAGAAEARVRELEAMEKLRMDNEAELWP